MKYFYDFLLIFLILAINFNCALNANKIKTLNSKFQNCIEFNSKNKTNLIQNFIEDSKNSGNSNTTYFLFFSSKNFI